MHKPIVIQAPTPTWKGAPPARHGQHPATARPADGPATADAAPRLSRAEREHQQRGSFQTRRRTAQYGILPASPTER